MSKIVINDDPSALIQALVDSFNNHTHSGVTTGAGSTGVPDSSDLITLTV